MDFFYIGFSQKWYYNQHNLKLILYLAAIVAANLIVVRFGPSSVIIVAFDLCGKDLACWCPLDEDCHVDILLELANET